MAFLRCTGQGGTAQLINNSATRVSTNNNYSGYIPVSENLNYVSIDYSKDWEIKVRLKLRNAGKSAIIGTASSSQYYRNPSVELSNARTSSWWGISSNGSSWSGSSKTLTYSEALQLNVWYDFILSFNSSTNTAELKVIRVSDGEIMGSQTSVVSGTIYQPTHSSYPLSLLGQAMDSQYIAFGNFNFDSSHSYIENDGVVIWGNK